MNTLDIEIAMMKKLGIRQNCIVPNVSWGIANLHECDLLILSKSGYASEIEIKITKDDLLKDREKKHGHNHNHIKYLWFAVPEKLSKISLDHIPERAGLYVLHKHFITHDLYPSSAKIPYNRVRYRIERLREPIPNKNAQKWTEKERLDLLRLGAMRILGLKESIAKVKYKYNG